MALHHVIQSEYGVQASYWRVANIVDDYVKGCLTVVLYGYVNRRIRLSNFHPVSTATLIFEGADYTPELKRADIYGAVKQKLEFKGSLDC